MWTFSATVAHADPCPPRATLDALAKEAWGHDAAVQPKCTAVRARKPLTFVVDIATFEGKQPPRGFDPLRNGAVGYAAIVNADGRVRWQQPESSETPGDWYEWSVVDLDGDGHDELVADHTHIGHMGSSDEELLIYTIGDGEPTQVAALPLEDHLPAKGLGQNSCASTHRLVRDGRRMAIEIVGKRGNDPQLSPVTGNACPQDGRRLYRWDGQDIVEKH